MAIFQLLTWGMMKTRTNSKTHTNIQRQNLSIVASSFLTKNAGGMTVPLLPKQEAAKVDIYSHCAIPLLHHTHPENPIPNTTKPAVTLSDQDLWSKSEITTVQQKRAQKVDIKWLINNIAGVKHLENMELNISNGWRIF